MNDKQLLQEKADALRRDLEALDAQIKSMPPDDGRWVPKRGEAYWSIIHGRMSEYIWVDDGPDHRMMEAGLVFRTEQEAEHALEVIKQINFAPYPEKGTRCVMNQNGRYMMQTCEFDWTGEAWQAAYWRIGMVREA